MMTPLAFDSWKCRLLESAGSVGSMVLQLGDPVLELFWKDGCEPTMRDLLDYAQSGLCRSYDVHVSPSPRASVNARNPAS